MNSIELQKKYGSVSLVADVIRCYQQGYEFIEKSLSWEEENKRTSQRTHDLTKIIEGYKSGIQILDQSSHLVFNPDQWDTAGQLQSKIWKTVQLAKYRIRELSPVSTQSVASTSQANFFQQSQPKTPQTTSSVPSYPAQRLSNTNTNAVNNNSNIPANTQPLSFLPGLFQTISQISQGQLTDDRMTRDQVIDLNRQTAKSMLQTVNYDPLVGQNKNQPHLGLPQNISELSGMLLEASLLPKIGQQDRPGSRAQTVGGPFQQANQQHVVSAIKKSSFAIEALAREPQMVKNCNQQTDITQKWEQIQWQQSVDAALYQASVQQKPIFLEIIEEGSCEVFHGKLDEISLFTASALSDDRVIKIINSQYIALPLNVTREGFPTDKLPALKHLENIFNNSWRSEFGFASCFALDDKGKMLLGSNWLFEDVDISKVDANIQFDPENYIRVWRLQLELILQFLTKAAERYKRLVAIQTSPNILEKVNGWKIFLVELGTDMRKAVENMIQFRTQTALMG